MLAKIFNSLHSPRTLAFAGYLCRRTGRLAAWIRVGPLDFAHMHGDRCPKCRGNASRRSFVALFSAAPQSVGLVDPFNPPHRRGHRVAHLGYGSAVYHLSCLPLDRTGPCLAVDAQTQSRRRLSARVVARRLRLRWRLSLQNESGTQ